MDLVHQHKEAFDNIILHLGHEIAGLRTGRATPKLVEDIPVEAYGARQPVKALASITVQDAKTLVVEPWDKSLLQAIDSAIRASNLGINPVNDGKLIRLPLPDLTQERRAELVKVLHQKLEQARISIRGVREDVRKTIEKQEKAGDIPEDEKYKLQDGLEALVKECNEKIGAIGTEKEAEIQKV